LNYPQKAVPVFFCCIFLFNSIIAQDRIVVRGFVKDANTKEPIENVSIYLEHSNNYTETNSNGFYEFTFPIDSSFTLIFSRLDYQNKSIDLSSLAKKQPLNVFLTLLASDIKEVIVSDSKVEQTGIIREGIAELVRLPNNSGNVESLLSGIALGVNTGIGGELSAQYNVRGGNYDENLVYVNGFEIYRPQLVRASVREGLTFPNPDLIKSLTFSSGGFQANYGDKLSSVLDLQYKRPESFAASIGVSLLGGSFHMEGKKEIGIDKKPLRYLLGLRYKNTNQLLNSFDTKEASVANFGDLQGMLTFDISPQLELSYLSNFNTNQYIFRPTQSTTIASASKEQSFELQSAFTGKETTDYQYTMNGLSLRFLPRNPKRPIYLSISAALYNNQEAENSGLLNTYELHQIDTKINSETFGERLGRIASGRAYTFVRNQLDSNISSFQHRGGIEFGHSSSSSSFLQWGMNYQKEVIEDQLEELERSDKEMQTEQDAIESIPIIEQLNSATYIASNRYHAFIQNAFTSKQKKNGSEFKLVTGVRANYWDFNQSLFISPRVQLAYSPNTRSSYHLATGLYYQSPFYRELRNQNGEINEEVLPQKSWQMVVGWQQDLFLKKRNDQKIELIVEAYYKKLWDLVSYDFEDVRIRYAGTNNAKGYALGIDIRVNGNFVPNTESWINFSFLRTREAITGIQHRQLEFGNPDGKAVKNVPRPSDRFMNLSIFFQDHFPRFKRLETYVNYNFGTGLPYGLDIDNLVFRNTFRYRSNHQLNIGFTFALWKESWRPQKQKHWLGFSENTWISLEVINLLNVRNVASNRIVVTTDGQFAVPNYLTSRTMNVRFRMEF